MHYFETQFSINFRGVALHRIRFRLGLCPRPCWKSLQRSPRPLAGFKGPTSKGREGREGKGGEGGREGEGRGGARGEDVEGPGKWSAPGPVLALGGPGGGGKKRGRGGEGN